MKTKKIVFSSVLFLSIFSSLCFGMMCADLCIDMMDTKEEKEEEISTFSLFVHDKSEQKKLDQKLAYAACHNQFELAKKAIEQGADVNYCEGPYAHSHNSALFFAYHHKNYEIAELIRSQNPESHIKQQALGEGLIHAAQGGETEQVEKLLGLGVDVNYKCLESCRSTALHRAANQNYPKIALILLEKRAKVNAKDNFGRTPFHYAVTGYFKKDQIERTNAIIQLLVEHGADIYALDKDKKSVYQTALEWECDQSTLSLLKKLTQFKCTISLEDETKDSYFSMQSMEEKSQKIYSKNQRKKYKKLEKQRVLNKILIGAVHNGDTTQFKKILKKGAKINGQDSQGLTPLHVATYRHDVPLVRLLLENHARINVRNKNGDTALHFICGYPFTDVDVEKIKEIITLFKEKGADINILNYRNQTPFDQAIEFGTDDNVLKMLRELGALSAKSLGMECSPKMVLVEEKNSESFLFDKTDPSICFLQ